MAFINAACASHGYPENMTNKERKAYYKKFNESKTEEEWRLVKNESKNQKDSTVGKVHNEDTSKSISFSVKNNSILPKKLKIVDNILTFKPFEKRYFGFEPNTEVYLMKGNKEEYLFTIKASDKGKEFDITK